jgi:hypothetical protein
VLAAVVATTAVSCSSSSSDGAGPRATSTTTTTEATTTAAAVASTAADSATTTTALGFEASDGPRSAPANGPGQALLRAVRVGRNDGFERMVFEFAGDATPGYRIRWVPGPILADGSGDPVEVEGEAYLEMIMDQASGVDMSDGTPTYTGPDRITVSQQTRLLTDLVRTGDFEAVLTWVAGSMRRAPFRVLTLTSPARLVVDVSTR